MRPTRDLLRRRMHLSRQRAHLIAHIQNTVHQYNLPALGVRLGKPTERGDVTECFPAGDTQSMVQLDLDLIGYYDQQLSQLEWQLVKQARAHDAQMYHLISSIRGIGKILTLVLLYEIQDIHRFPTSGQFLSYARLVRCAKESAGKKVGKSNKKIGNSYLRWAFGGGGALPERQSASSALAGEAGEPTRQGQGAGDPVEEAGPDRLCDAEEKPLL